MVQARYGWGVRLEGPRSQWVLYLNAFLMNAGFFMLIPLVSVHYTRDLGMTATAVGSELAIRLLTQQGLSLFGGALADRRGYKAPIVAGLLLRSVGFGMFAFADTFTRLLAGAMVAALGGVFFESTGKAALASLVRKEDRHRSFSLYNLGSNAGMTLGPLVGVTLVDYDFGLLSAAAAAAFLLAGIQTWAFLPNIPAPAETRSLLSGIAIVWLDRRFVAFTVILAGFWFVTMQLYITLPLHVSRTFGSESSLGILYATNSLLALALQYPLIRLMSRRFSSAASVAIGVAVLAVGMGLVPFAPGLPALLGCIALYAAGRAIVEPSLNSYVSEVASPSNLGSYFGFAALSLAIGGSLANYAAGVLYDVSIRLQEPALPWLVIGSVGALVALILAGFAYGLRRAATGGAC